MNTTTATSPTAAVVVADGVGRLPITRFGQTIDFALVDPEDLPRLSAHTWGLHARGYPCRYEHVNGQQRTVYLHREVLGLDYEGSPRIYFRNRDGRDCRKTNLRVTTSWLARKLAAEPSFVNWLTHFAGPEQAAS